MATSPYDQYSQQYRPQPYNQPQPYQPAPAPSPYVAPKPAAAAPAPAPVQKASTPYAPVASNPNTQYASQLQNAYRQYLGRDASAQEIQQRLADPRFNISTHISSIASSPEATAYRQRSAMQTSQPAAAPTQTYSTARTAADQGKLANADYHTPKYDLIRLMQKYDPNSMLVNGPARQQFLNELRSNPFYKDARFEGDKIFYTGQQGQPVQLDVLNSFKAGKPEWQYLTSDHSGDGGGRSSNSAGGNVQSVGQAVGNASGPGPSPGPGWVLVNGGWVPPDHPLAIGAKTASSTASKTPTMGSEIEAKVRELLKLDPSNVSLQDKTLKPQLNSFAMLRDRLRQKSLESAAEGMAAQGLDSSAAMDSERRMANENYSDDVTGYGANLMGEEVKARRQQLMDALQTGAGLYTEQQKMQLQNELARLDDATRRYGIDSQARTAQADVNARIKAMMLQNEQFNKDLGFRIGDREAAYNQNAWQAFAGY